MSEKEYFRDMVFKDINMERARQAAKFDDQEPGELGVLSDWEMYPVLLEEAGEVAKELNERGDDKRLLEELTQVAAVAVKWCEIIYRRKLSDRR